MAEERSDIADEAPARMGKSNMVLIIIIAVLATIVIGGGAALLFVMSKSGHEADKQATTEEAATNTATADKGDKDSKKKDKGKKEGPKGPAIYIGMEPPFVVNFDEKQTVRFLQITIQIMTRDPATSSLIKDNEPVVRNDLLTLFGGQNSTELGTREGKENLRKQALDVVKAIVKNEGGKPDLVEAVYFTTFVMQ